jgi:prepilin-type N-terminal cleavage/methylation domain-containing protein
MKHSGYSLIEVLVVLVILGVLFGTGYASFRGFNRNHTLVDSAKKIQSDLRLAQEMALSGQKPADVRCSGTNHLNGYFFNVLAANRYEIRASCSGGNVTSATKDVVLTGGITIAAPFPVPNPILFKVLGQGTNIGSSANIIVAQTGVSTPITIVVSTGGQIQ